MSERAHSLTPTPPVSNNNTQSATHARTVHWHLVNLCGVVLLNVTEDLDVVVGCKVDGDALAPKATATADAAHAQRGGGHKMVASGSSEG